MQITYHLIILLSITMCSNCIYLLKKFSRDCTILKVSLSSSKKTLHQDPDAVIISEINSKSIGFIDYAFKSQEEDVKFPSDFKRPVGKFGGNCIFTIIVLGDEFNYNLTLLTSSLMKLRSQLAPDNSPFVYRDKEKVAVIIECTKTSNNPLILNVFAHFGLQFKYIILQTSQTRWVEVDGDPNPSEMYSVCQFCKYRNKSPFKIPIGFGFEKKDFPFYNYQENFHGTVIRVSAAESVRARFNYTLDEKDGKTLIATNGMYVPIVEYLKNKFNFSYKIVRSRRGFGVGNKRPNGSWDGTVGDLLMNDIDLGISLGETMERSEILGFTSGVVNEDLTLVYGPPKKKFPWVAIFWPLSPNVWILIFTSIGFTTCYLYYEQELAPRTITGQRRGCWSLEKLITFNSAVFLLQAIGTPKTSSIRMRSYLSLWLICTMVLTTAYLSKLMNFLTFPIEEPVPDSIVALANSDYSWGLAYVGGVAYSSLKTSKILIFRKIADKMEKMTNHSECYRRTIENNFVCISYSSLALHYIYAELCDKYGNSPAIISRNTFSSIQAGLAMSKRSVFLGDFEKWIKIIVARGLPSYWEQEDYKTLLRGRSKEDKEKVILGGFQEMNILTFKHFTGAIMLFGGGILVAMIAFSLEVIINRSRLNFRSKL